MKQQEEKQEDTATTANLQEIVSIESGDDNNDTDQAPTPNPSPDSRNEKQRGQTANATRLSNRNSPIANRNENIPNNPNNHRIVSPVEIDDSNLHENQEGDDNDDADADDDWAEHVSAVARETTDQVSTVAREALHSFFYPASESHNNNNNNNNNNNSNDGAVSAVVAPSAAQTHFDEHFREQDRADRVFVENFWKTFDDILMLSLFAQLGVVCRLLSSIWFGYFDGIFSADGPLFTNLPLNCLSAFIMGLLCSGERLMEIITTRFSPPHLQHDIQQEYAEETSELLPDRQQEDEEDGDPGRDDNSDLDVIMTGDSNNVRPGIWRRTTDRVRHGHNRALRHYFNCRRIRQRSHFVDWEPPVRLNEDLREVQLLALERRIRASKCLLLFPVKKQDIDVVENYFDGGYKRRRDRIHNLPRDPAVRSGLHFDRNSEDMTFDLALNESDEDNNNSHNHASDMHQQQQSRSNNSVSPISLLSSLSEHKDKSRRDNHEGGDHPQDYSDHNRSRQLNDTNDTNDDQLVGSLRSPSPTNQVDPLTTIDLNENVNENDQRNNNNLRISGRTEEKQFQQNNNGEIGENNIPLNIEQRSDMNQIMRSVSADVTENWSRLRRVHLANGWDQGTTPEAMSDDLMLGLRVGFCGALSSFSSWNSQMVSLLKDGRIGDAVVGYMLGLQLPIIAYRFGQHMAVYYFIWKCRREKRRDERRGGYGIRVAMDEEDSERNEETMNNLRRIAYDDDDGAENAVASPPRENGGCTRETSGREKPSGRAILTAVFIMAIVAQGTSISFFSDSKDQQVALSLLFSPLGVLARWRLSKLNLWRPTFPIGTFTANILACALSGWLGDVLAGNPGDEERIVLVSIVAGFGGTLSSLAIFIVEVLAGIDPVLLRFDGMVYAVLSLFWAMVVGFIFSSSVEWMDRTTIDQA